MEELNKCISDTYLWIDMRLSSQSGYFCYEDKTVLFFFLVSLREYLKMADSAYLGTKGLINVVCVFSVLGKNVYLGKDL